MTKAEFIALAAVTAMVILIEIQIWILKIALQREIKNRKEITAINRAHIRGIWNALWVADIPRPKKDGEAEDDNC